MSVSFCSSLSTLVYMQSTRLPTVALEAVQRVYYKREDRDIIDICFCFHGLHAVVPGFYFQIRLHLREQ